MIKKLIAYDYINNIIYEKVVALDDSLDVNSDTYARLINNEFRFFAGQIAATRKVRDMFNSNDIIDPDEYVLENNIIKGSGQMRSGLIFRCFDNFDENVFDINALNKKYPHLFFRSNISGEIYTKDVELKSKHAYVISGDENDFNKDTYHVMIIEEPYSVFLFTDEEKMNKIVDVISKDKKNITILKDVKVK